jgi:hypothetical protein
VKAFFVIVLIAALAFPLYLLVAGLGVMAHNQYDTRLHRLDVTESPRLPGMHLGLTGAELSRLDGNTAFAYEDAVHDGYRLGRGYSVLSLECLALDILLLLTSIVGLLACRVAHPSNQALQR